MSNQEPAYCRDFPVNLGLSNRMKLQIFLVGQMNMQTLFEGSFKQNLQQLKGNLTNAVNKGLVSQADATSLGGLIDDLCNALADTTTLHELCTTPSSSWPPGVDSASQSLQQKGLFLPYLLIPGAKQSDVVDLFDNQG